MRSSQRLQNLTQNDLRGASRRPSFFLPDTGKLFEINEQGVGIEQIAVGSWLCGDSDIPENCRRDIILALHEAGFTERQDKSEAENQMANRKGAAL